MSWDVSILRLSTRYRSVSEIPKDDQLIELGSRADVHAAISEVFIGVDWSDPTWGIYDGEFGSVEFNNGGEEPLKGFMMHVRASEEIISLIVTLCERQGWSALDCSTGGMIDQSDEPGRGLSGWRAFRDEVLGDDKAK